MADDRAVDDRAPEDQVRWQLDGAVARITIDAPDRGNALTMACRDRLADLLALASDSIGVRAVVLTGTGERHFCTGAALGGPRKEAPPRPREAPERAVGDAARLIRQGWQRLVSSILDCEKPVVAAVNGTAAGGGAQLVLACDLVVMADHARIIEVFVRRGIMPDAGGAYLLPRVVGLHRAKELMFLGDDLSAVDAHLLGIANRVVAGDELEDAAHDLAARLADGPTRAISMTKWLLNRSFESSRQTAFDEEAFAQELVNATDDAREGMAAFIERRSPAFRGW
jgi:2-(1,2-epoxy-1,2-dihydrophenyl)acetyl-CoA isomerase